MNKQPKIFGVIINLPIFQVLKPFYIKNKEVLMYLLFGGLTFILNIILYTLFARKMHINVLIANIICWGVCVLFQFFTNRTWVFDGSVNSASEFMEQITMFFCGRLFTLVVEEVILAVFITCLGFHGMLIKLIAQFIVIVLNYIISKLIVFKG